MQRSQRVVEVWVRPVPDHLVDTALLDQVETDRLAWLRDDATRLSYAAGHVLVRTALADLLGGKPSDFAFDRTCSQCGNQHGRPILLQDRGVHVSLSRTATSVAVAVTRAGPVGVDVETVSATDFEGFAEAALHPGERGDVEVPTPQERLRRRAVSWVRKEAALKALGVGLRRDPASLRTPASGIPTRWDGFEKPFVVLDLSLPLPQSVGAVGVVDVTRQLTVRAR